MKALKGYMITGKETDVKSIIVQSEDYYKVVVSEEGGLVEGTTYSETIYQELVKGYTVVSVEVEQEPPREGGQHCNINVLNRGDLLEAQKHPEEFPQLCVRVSGFCVRFNALTKEQQDDVITRTFHNKL